MQFFLGLDIGTTHTKAVALTDDGHLLAHAERQNETYSPLPGHQEQDPAAIFQNVADALREGYEKALANGGGQLRGVAFSSAMHSLMATDEAGKPLTNAWLWSDLRAAECSDRLRRDSRWQNFYHQTGTPIHPMSPAVKLAWLAENDPTLLHRVHKFLGIKEFVFQQIFGKAISDRSVASATGLLDTRTGHWCAPVLASIGLLENQLPALVSSLNVDILGVENATRLGLPAGTPLVIGASDGALANLGSEVTSPDILALTIGTSAAVRICLPEPYFEPSGRMFCYHSGGQDFVVGGASNNGGNVLDWLVKTLTIKEINAPLKLLALAETVPLGSNGLLFLPYVFGERAPIWNPMAKPQFIGETPQHTAAHRIRAALEGVMFNLKMIVEMLPNHREISSIHASGGFVRSRFWLQMLADIFGLPVRIPKEETVDASARGAVMLGRKALGMSALPPVSFAEKIEPNPANQALYAGIFMQFRSQVVRYLS